MARVPKPDWDVSRDPPDYRSPVDSSQQYTSERLRTHNLGDYSASTSATQRAVSRRMAAQVAGQRRKRSFFNGRWFEGDKLIGTSDGENGVLHRVKPRSLGRRGVS